MVYMASWGLILFCFLSYLSTYRNTNLAIVLQIFKGPDPAAVKGVPLDQKYNGAIAYGGKKPKQLYMPVNRPALYPL